jgi:hypothetical protein
MLNLSLEYCLKKRREIVWLFERLLASQDGLCPMESRSSLETSRLDVAFSREVRKVAVMYCLT